MKYIRTKDGRIYKIFKEDISLVEKNDGYACYGENTVDFMTAIYIPKPVEKVADTIEELCDGFFVISEEYDEPHYVKRLLDTNALDFENNWQPYGNGKVLDQTCQKLIDAIIYGAILIVGENGEPILKSVAKMNEKGEFELL